MIGLLCLEVYNCFFNITEEKNNFQFCTDTFDEFPFVELLDELEEIPNISNYTPEHLQDKIIGPLLVSAHKKREAEKKWTDVYYILLLGYNQSPFRVFESYLRIVVVLNEDDIQLILEQFNSIYITYEITPGIYTIKDISEAVYTMRGYETSLRTKNDDISMKIQLVLTRFGGTLGTLGFDEKSFF